MNERIKALLTPRLKEWGADLDDNFSEEMNKFAELIIRECTELTLDYKSEAYYNGWLDYRDEIKEHFGVE